jgi:hypothetical protein
MERFLLPLFLILAGLVMCGVPLPRWVAIIGGVCGIAAGLLMLF